MKNQLILLGLASVSAVFLAPSSKAAIVLSENFEDSATVIPRLAPGSEFIQLPSADPNEQRYWDLSNSVDPTMLNPSITGNATNYLTGQNMDTPMPFSQFTPAIVDFNVDVTGNSDLRLSIDLAGLTSPEPENFVRVFTDDDGDGFYETPVFNFQGTGNLPYTETTTGQQLTPEFQTFADLILNTPIAADGMLRVRLEMYNDTNSRNEAIGIDNVVITGIPEPSSLAVLAGAVGVLGLVRRRRA